jgi:hypothetical protein
MEGWAIYNVRQEHLRLRIPTLSGFIRIRAAKDWGLPW